jgi:hypothetical protein
MRSAEESNLPLVYCALVLHAHVTFTHVSSLLAGKEELQAGRRAATSKDR